MKKLFLLGLCLAICACVGPEEVEYRVPIRDGYPVDEVWVVNGLAETISLINSQRFSLGEEPWAQKTICLTARVPNKIALDGTNGLIVNSGANSLSLFSLRNPQAQTEILLPQGSNPWDACFLKRGDREYALVSGFMSNSLFVVDLQRKILEREIKLTKGSRPEGVLVVGDRVWVAMTGYNFALGDYDQGKIAIIDVQDPDPQGWFEEGEILVEKNPQTLLLDREGRVHLLATARYLIEDGFYQVFEVSTRQLLKSVKLVGNPQTLAYDDLAGVIHLVGAGLYRAYRTSDLLEVEFPGIKSLVEASDPAALAVDSQRRLLYLADFSGDRVLVISLEAQEVVGVVPVGLGPVALGFGRTW